MGSLSQPARSTRYATITMQRIRLRYIHPCHKPLTDPLAKPKEMVYQGSKRLMNKRIVATPAISSALVQRLTSNLKAGSEEEAAGAGGVAAAVAGLLGAGASWAVVGAGLSAVPQEGQ